MANKKTPDERAYEIGKPEGPPKVEFAHAGGDPRTTDVYAPGGVLNLLLRSPETFNMILVQSLLFDAAKQYLGGVHPTDSKLSGVVMDDNRSMFHHLGNILGFARGPAGTDNPSQVYVSPETHESNRVVAEKSTADSRGEAMTNSMFQTMLHEILHGAGYQDDANLDAEVSRYSQNARTNKTFRSPSVTLSEVDRMLAAYVASQRNAGFP